MTTYPSKNLKLLGGIILTINLQKKSITVSIDGRSVGFSKVAPMKFEPAKIRACLQYIEEYLEKREIDVEFALFIPAFIKDDDFRKEMKGRGNTDLHLVTGLKPNDPRDDKYALGETILSDGFFVSNDKRMHEHSYNRLIDRAWIASRRIGFRFEKGPVFIPGFPEQWHKTCSELGSRDGNKEVIE